MAQVTVSRYEWVDQGSNIGDNYVILLTQGIRV